MITVGYGDVGAGTEAERILAIVAMCAGVIFFSLMVGSLTSLLSDLDKKNAAYEDKIKILDTIVQRFEVKDAKLLSKVHLAVKSRIYAQDDSYNELLDFLPKKLSVSLGNIIYKPMVEKIKFFQDIDPEILIAVAPELHLCRFMAGEVIINKEEYPNEIYFIKSGTVGLAIPEYNNDVFMRIPEGSYFGETDIIYNTHRKFTAIAETVVEVLALERKHFIRVFFKEFKEHGRAIKAHAEKRLAKQIKTYDLYKHIAKDFFESQKLKSPSSYKSGEKREKQIKDYLQFVAQDTIMELDPKFSPSFLERNKGIVPAQMGKREEEDILLENNERLPKILKEIDSKFARVEEMLHKVVRMMNNPRLPASGGKTPGSASFY